MPEDYEVQTGDCMSSIAYSRGFFWETLWNLSENATLKSTRNDPNVLMEGDIVHIPDLTKKQESRATDARHKFKLNGVPEVLRIKILDSDQKPRPNLDYTLTIDGMTTQGKTDANGELKQSIPPNAKSGQLKCAAPPDASGIAKMQVMALELGDLNPISDVSGLKARLANLGFYNGPIDSTADEALKQAVSAFQKKQNLTVTGEADDATKSALQQQHGH